MDCMILGDSIAVGTSQFAKCKTHAQVGISSRAFNKKYDLRSINADTVLISLGSNDFGIVTKTELLKLRSKVKAKTVYWVLPASNLESRDAVEEVARLNGDWLIRIPSLSKDGIHPTTTGYRKIADIAFGDMRYGR